MSQEMLVNKLKSLGLPKTKYQPVEMLLKAYSIASNYHNHMASLELASLNEELKFYRVCHAAQRDFTHQLTSLFRTGYSQFVNELSQGLSEPLRALIAKFWLMKNESSELNLKDFLGSFKTCAGKFETLLTGIDKIKTSSANIA